MSERSRRDRLPGAALPQHEIARLYDSLARVYDLWAALTESRARRRALELAAIQDGETILEVAVGTGLAFREIVARNPSGRNIGIDLSPGMLARARRRLRDVPPEHYELRVGSALDLDVETASVDLLVNAYMLDLLSPEDMDRALAEFRRVLRPRGRLVLAAMTKGERRGSGLYERLHRISPRLMGGCRSVQLAPRLREHGFQVLTREYVQQLLFPSEIILARR